MIADRAHLHHTLIGSGLSARQTLTLLLIYATCCALVGLTLERVSESVSLLVYFLLFIGHCLFVIRSSERLKARRENQDTG